MTDCDHLVVYLYITMLDSWLLPGPDLWPDLDTSLVTCDRLHILTSVACLPLWQLYSVFIHVDYQLYYSAVIYLVIQFHISAVVLIIIYAHCSLHELFPLHTHSPWSRSDDPGFARPDIGRFVSVVQVFDETVHNARSLSSSLFLVSSSLLYFCHFLILPLSPSAAIFLSLFICYHCDCHGYVLLQWPMIMSWFTACSG